jgi:hypothetical protein
MPKIEQKESTRIEFLQTGVDIYNGYKISKDGLSREEDVEVMKGFNEDDKGRNVGWRVFKKVFGGAEKDNGSDKPEQ